MPTATHTRSRNHSGEQPSIVNLLAGWAKQGMDTFLATQRILLDVAIRQNASVMNTLREQLTNPRFSPAQALTELTGEGVANFIEAQKVLLDLAQEQNKIVMTGVKERVGSSATAYALSEVLRRSVENFIAMQQEFLTIAGRQTHGWLEAAKAGKPLQGRQFVELAREATENFVRAQKRFLDVVTEEAERSTGKEGKKAGTKIKRTELSQLARQAVEAFIEAQKKLFDVAGRQMKANVAVASKAVEQLRPFPFIPLGDLTRQGVKSYVDASKALMDVVLARRAEQKPEKKATHRAKRRVHRVKPEQAAATAAA